jgi:hypothetical protein
MGKKQAMKYPELEAILDTIKTVYSLEWEREYYFAYPKYKYRFDYAIPAIKIALEVEGGLWNYGRHNTPTGYQEDCIKYTLASVLGWTLLRFTTIQVKKNLFVYPTKEKPNRDYVRLDDFVLKFVKAKLEGKECDLFLL